MKRPVSKSRAKSSPIVVADHWQAVKTTKPPALSTKTNAAVDYALHEDPDAGGPMLITPQAGPRHVVDASGIPAQIAKPAAIATAPANDIGGSSFSIRVASSLSEGDARATLSQLQRQFPGLLGNGSVNRDDLGREGVFYRVRIGPLSRESADKVCSRLKAAGRTCVLTRR